MLDSFKGMLKQISNQIGKGIESSEESIALLAAREIHPDLPISIPTANAFYGDRSDNSKLTKVLLINLRTMIRNIINSVNDNRRDLKRDDVLNTLQQECNIILDWASEMIPNTKVEFYLLGMDGLYNDFRYAKPREFNKLVSEIFFMMTEAITNKLIGEMDKKEGKSFTIPFRFEKGWKLGKAREETTLLTHLPTDLLSQYQFPKLQLLESHTGAIKLRKDWYTKVNRGVEYLPFSKFILQVCGDGVYFNVCSRKIKQSVESIAKEYKWNSLTTESRMRYAINNTKRISSIDKSALLQFF